MLFVLTLISFGILINSWIIGSGNNFEEVDVSFPELEEINSGEIYELSRSGIIKYTNEERKDYELPLLSESEQLNKVADRKVNDMFNRQYFAHTSPTGEEAKDIAADIGYDYILIGENLAKGLFEGDHSLVEGWMNSPDHRDNILKDGYEEIGIGIKMDYFNNEEIWIAVQIFGTPSDTCPYPDESLRVRIEEKNEKLEELIQRIKTYDDQIEMIHPPGAGDYNELIKERNVIATKHNNLRSELQEMIVTYNLQVEERNNCIESY